MGGLALKELEGIRRYEKAEFYQLASDLVPLIKVAFNTEVELVKSYHLKESFGDMDLLVLNRGNLPKVEEALASVGITPRKIHYNGNVYSFDYKDLQVDLIMTPLSNWETSQVFFSYNDLGNLMGKIFHKFGLKYGYDGVKYIYRLENDKKLGDITVTKDMRKAFDFLGLSYAKFSEGFDTVEDIFNFVVGSPYFQKEAFYFENLNAINKKRNKRRANYKLFLEFVNGTGAYEGRPALPDKDFIFNKDKSQYFQLINDFFPENNFLEEMDRLKEKERLKLAVAAKYNGNRVMEIYPTLKGKELGSVLGYFKARMAKLFGDFDAYVLMVSEEKLYRDFDLIYKEYQNADQSTVKELMEAYQNTQPKIEEDED